MNDTPRDTNASGFRPNGEELDVVLGRFQAWAEVYRNRAQEPGGRGPVAFRGPLRATVKPTVDDARDISYERALRASRYRRVSEMASIDPLLSDLASQKADFAAIPRDSAPLENSLRPPTPSDRPLSPRVRSMEEVHCLSPEPPNPKAVAAALETPRTPPASIAWAAEKQAMTTKETGAANLNKSQELETTETPASATVAFVAPSISRVEQAAGAPLGSQVKAPSVLNPIALPPTAVEFSQPAVRSAPKPPRAGRSRNSDVARVTRHVQPAFRDVLRGTAALAAASQLEGTALQSGKSTSLALRVSDVEQARIQACAARANLSVSAYLRQCALGVDELRQQVEVALSDLQKYQAPSAAAPPGISAIPAILGRFALDCLHRLRRKPEDYTVISLR